LKQIVYGKGISVDTSIWACGFHLSHDKLAVGGVQRSGHFIQLSKFPAAEFSIIIII